jgi:hypothetical protein
MPGARKYTIQTLLFYIPTLSFAIVSWLFAGGCTTTPTYKKGDSSPVSTSVDTSALHGSWLTPESMTPLQFLATIKQKDSSVPLGVLTMLDSFPEDWAKKKDIDTLIKLVNSREKCYCFLNPLSSHIPNDSADLGGYAIQLIESYKGKKKLSFGLYACPKTNKIQADKLVSWWKVSSGQ